MAFRGPRGVSSVGGDVGMYRDDVTWDLERRIRSAGGLKANVTKLEGQLEHLMEDPSNYYAVLEKKAFFDAAADKCTAYYDETARFVPKGEEYDSLRKEAKAKSDDVRGKQVRMGNICTSYVTRCAGLTPLPPTTSSSPAKAPSVASSKRSGRASLLHEAQQLEEEAKLDYEQAELDLRQKRLSMEREMLKAKVLRRQADDASDSGSICDVGTRHVETWLQENMSNVPVQHDVLRVANETPPGIESEQARHVAPQDTTPSTNNATLSTLVEAIQGVQAVIKQGIVLTHGRREKFDGNPLHYFEFIKTFEETVAHQVREPAMQLRQLINSCEGRARKMIQSCSLITPAERGLDEALDLLRGRFGQRHMVVRAHLDTITKGPQVRDTEDGLSDFLTSLVNSRIILTEHGYATDLDTYQTTEALFERLPRHLQSQLNDRLAVYLNAGGQVKFSQIEQFIRDKVKSSTNALGRVLSKVRPRVGNAVTHTVVSAPAKPLTVEKRKVEVRQRCHFCGNDHQSMRCSAYLQRRTDDRWAMVESNKLCFNCLGKSHTTRNCNCPQRCLRGSPVPLDVKCLFGGGRELSRLVSLSIRGIYEDSDVFIPSVFAVSQLPSLESSIPCNDVVDRYGHLKGLEFPDPDRHVELLIGAGCKSAHCVVEQRIGGDDEPNAVRTVLGWALVGPERSLHAASTSEARHTYNACCTMETLHQKMKQMFSQDFSECDFPARPVSVEDGKALERMEASVAKVRGHCQIALPWKDEERVLPDSREMAIKRLMSLKKRFVRDPRLHHMYNLKMNEYLSSGYAVVVPKDCEREIPGRTWYVPHHHATRGEQVNVWINGPSFLHQSEDSWPVRPSSLPTIPDSDPEVKKETQSHAAVISVTTPLFKLLSRFSSLTRLQRSFVWLARFKFYLSYRLCHGLSSAHEWLRGPLSVDESRVATMDIVKLVQAEAFVDVMTSLVDHSDCTAALRADCGRIAIGRGRRVLFKLRPILVKGILRVGGRLSYSSFEEDTRHPIILPSRHAVTSLVIHFYHDIVGHSGPQHVLSAVRERFWIVRGLSSVRYYLKSCRSCRFWKAKVGEQVMAPLPSCRSTPGNPVFTHSGVDYMGPLMVKIGRSHVKRYVCVFTCLASRAIHLEVAHSLDTMAFIHALRRFLCRRGFAVKHMYSDNGLNFVGAEKELRTNIQNWNVRQIDQSLSQRGIQWHFNPPHASHQGGVWERMIRSVRKILRQLSWERTMDDDSLQTYMAEIEYILNSRPLTAVSDDPRDLNALTPNSILTGVIASSYSPGVFMKGDGYRKSWKAVQYLTDRFWDQWTKSYLPLLQLRQKWLQPVRNFAVGDVVLMVTEGTKRSEWPKARVVEVFPDKEGAIRRVKVRTEKSMFIRDIRKLCLLESA
ncbi:uncharacterized protein LOC144751211 [Ciona intestinalis]